MGLPADHADVDAVYLTVYKNFMEAIDAIDNGVNQWDSDAPPKYVNNTHLSARVGGLNPSWNQDQSGECQERVRPPPPSVSPTSKLSPVNSPSLSSPALSAAAEATLKGFLAAVALTGSEFLDSVRYHAQAWLPARALVAADLAAAPQVDPSGAIVKLNSFCPWKEHLHQLEGEMGVEGRVKYVVSEDDREKKWRVQAVGVAPGSFESRKPLPTAWRGLRDAELSEVCGVPGGVFVHASGFIGGNDTLEGALEMARRALTLD